MLTVEQIKTALIVRKLEKQNLLNKFEEEVRFKKEQVQAVWDAEFKQKLDQAEVSLGMGMRAAINADLSFYEFKFESETVNVLEEAVIDYLQRKYADLGPDVEVTKKEFILPAQFSPHGYISPAKRSVWLYVGWSDLEKQV